MPIALEQELKYFEEHLDEFMEKAPGKFVLIKGEKDFGFFDNSKNAYKKGIALFGIEPFFIREVKREADTYENPALFLGVMHANI